MIFVALPKGDTHIVLPVDMINAVEPIVRTTYSDILARSSVAHTLEGSWVHLKCAKPARLSTDALPHEVYNAIRSACAEAAVDATGRPVALRWSPPLHAIAERGDRLNDDGTVAASGPEVSEDGADVGASDGKEEGA